MRACCIALVGFATITGCAEHGHSVGNTGLSSAEERPQPPAGAAFGISVPDPDASTINSGVGGEEALWHVRAALNVAALSCGRRAGGAEIVRRYNALLTDRKPILTAAYADEAGRRDQAALDRHMTQLYNFFAQPPAQSGFCAAAAEVSGHADSLSAADAAPALHRLETPILDYYRAYASYRRELAAWQARPATVLADRRMKAKTVPSAKSQAPAQRMTSAWRIQLGAFTGKPAARMAWQKARYRLPSLAVYRPHYQKVPDSALVRLQVGKAADRASAIRLCAIAAAGGFDCFPVAR
jgi:cell division septation protein DedD